MATGESSVARVAPEPVLSAAEREFAVIYFDTEPLRAHGWPMPRATTVTVFELAREIGLPVCIPEPVDAELAAQFMREFAAVDEKISTVWRDVEGLFRRVNAPPAGLVQKPTAREARAAYERAVAATLRAHGLITVPRSERPLAEYFDLALNQAAPFDSEGRGFKDAVILFSAVDDLRRRKGPGLLVTRDKDFRGAEVLAARLGAQLIIRNVDDAASLLRRRLSDPAQGAYAAAERQALALAQQELARISQFITENLQVSSAVLAAPTEQLLRFLAVHVTRVKRVQADPPFNALETGHRVKLTYTIGVQLLADVMPLPATLIPPAAVKVGGTIPTSDEARDQLVQILMARDLRSRQGHKVIPHNVELDAEVTRTAEGFEHLTPLAVRLKDRDLHDVFEMFRDLLSISGERPAEPVEPGGIV